VWAIYRTGGASVAAKAVVSVRTRVSIKPARRSLHAGSVLAMHGRVAGPIPIGGALVDIQAKRGHHWQTFRPAHADRSGAFKTRYRFVGGPGVRHYALRAYVPQQDAYPYAATTSGSFTERVTG